MVAIIIVDLPPIVYNNIYEVDLYQHVICQILTFKCPVCMDPMVIYN